MSGGFIIHYHTTRDGAGSYNGTDVLDTPAEYRQRLEFRATEGWRVERQVASVPNYTVMTMEVRS